jgi:glutamate-ammonia-ligase adenylyltransferase
VFDAALLLAVAYPALASAVRRHPEDVAQIVSGDLSLARTRVAYDALLGPALGDRGDERQVRSGLRRFGRRERMRIALREVLPRALGGADVDVTSRELAVLADATIDAALDEAIGWARRRYGAATRSDGCLPASS